MPLRLILLLATGLAILVGIGAWALHERDGHDVIHLRVPTARNLKVGAAVLYRGIRWGPSSIKGSPRQSCAFRGDHRGRIERRDVPIPRRTTGVTRSGLWPTDRSTPGACDPHGDSSGDTLYDLGLRDKSTDPTPSTKTWRAGEGLRKPRPRDSRVHLGTIEFRVARKIFECFWILSRYARGPWPPVTW